MRLRLDTFCLQVSHSQSQPSHSLKKDQGNRQGQIFFIDLNAGIWKPVITLSAAKLKPHSALDLAMIILHITTCIIGHDAKRWNP